MAYSKKEWVTGDTITKDELNRMEEGIDSCQNMFNYKGNCLFADLPASGNSVNDTYYVTDKECGYTWNGNEWSQSGAYGTSISELKSDLVELDNAMLKGYKKLTPYKQDNTIRSQYVPSGVSDDNFTTFYYHIKKGAKVYIDNTPIGGGAYGIVTYLTYDEYYLWTDVDSSSITTPLSKYEVTMPDNADVLAVSCLAVNANDVGVFDVDIVDNYKNSMVYGGINSGRQIFVKKKRNNNEDLCVMIEPTVGNSLYGFSHIFKVENSGALNTDVANSASRDLLSIPTDMFSPYIVQAINNIDGDLQSGYENTFTGGSHQYNNSSSGSTPTARTANLKVFADGIELKNDFRYANCITIEFDNYIQANNTKKEDGTGREVLKEHWSIKCTTNGFECSNEIIALEDVKISRYYGLQTYSLSNKTFLIGGNKAYFGENGGYSENKKCYSVKCINDNLTICCDIDNGYGLGANPYSDSVAYSMAKVGLKTYYSAIYDETFLSENDELFIRGKYNFA